MRKLLLAMTLTLALVGCMGGEDESATGPAKTGGSIRPGVYQTLFTSRDVLDPHEMTLESNFKADGSYVGKIFLADGTNSCLIVEGTSTWTATATSYTLGVSTLKVREGCTGEWTTEQLPQDITQIRNVTDTSFEEYLEWENQPAEWIKFNKI